MLVADDEPLLPDVLASLLAEDGDTVQTVGDGREALARFHKDHFDLVVTDRSLPELNGDCLAAAFKHAAPGVPVIMLTGFGDLMSATGDLPAGVDLVLPKPVTREAVAQAVP